MSIIKKYIIKTDPAIDQNDADYFFKRVPEILNMDVRWKNHDFKYVGNTDHEIPNDFKYNDPNNTPAKDTYDILIVLLTRSIKHKLLELTGTSLHDQPKTDGYGKVIDLDKVEFSYTFFTEPKVIIIDFDNWTTSYKKLNIKKNEYEQYVIFHEIGHAIGKNHKPIPTDGLKPYPIMYQATLGLPDLKRFLPYPNESDE